MTACVGFTSASGHRCLFDYQIANLYFLQYTGMFVVHSLRGLYCHYLAVFKFSVLTTRVYCLALTSICILVGSSPDGRWVTAAGG